MSYTPKEVNEQDSPASVDIPNYNIFNSETDEDGFTKLNFSLNSGKDLFPDYTAERRYSNEEKEIWKIRNGAGTVEAEINKQHSSKDELAYKLQNVYESLK